MGVYEAVIDEQEKQRGTGTSLNMEKIASLCGEASSQSKLVAIQRAKQDEAEALVYLQDQRDAAFSRSGTSIQFDASEIKDWETLSE